MHHFKYFAIIAFVALIGCNQVKGPDSKIFNPMLKTDSGEPGYIAVQHCLIGFKGSMPGKADITRSQEEAEQLARELFELAKSNDDFDTIVKENTDDSYPGIYHIANTGFRGDMRSENTSNIIYPRNQMMPAFGNIGFKLEVGDVGLAEYDSHASGYGWHIIKRLK